MHKFRLHAVYYHLLSVQQICQYHFEWLCASKHARKYLMVSSTEFTKKFSPGDPSIRYSLKWEVLTMSEIHDYLQFLEIPPCTTDISHIDFELRKRLFRIFRNFLPPGLKSPETRISRDKTKFWKIVVILTILGKSTIFQSPLKSVDGGWHRRYKISDLSNHSIITPQNIM